MKVEAELTGAEEKTFKEYAEREFNGDHGLALRELVRELLVRADQFMPIYATLQEHEMRIQNLEKRPKDKPLYKEKRMLDGTVKRWKVGGRRDEQNT